MRALLIDADPSAAHAIARMLTASGIITDQADCTKHALKLAQHATYDVILLDPMLHDADGYDVLARILAATKAPVLALSCSDQARARALAGGAADCMVKPFGRTELIARLRGVAKPRRIGLQAAAD